MSTLPEGYNVSRTVVAIGTMESLPELDLKQTYHEPAAEHYADGKALINFLMQDRFFLARLRSNDPIVRADAIAKLNKAHYQAYGD